MIIIDGTTKFNKNDVFITNGFVLYDSGSTTITARSLPRVPQLSITSQSPSADREYKRFFHDVLAWMQDHVDNTEVHNKT